MLLAADNFDHDSKEIQFFRYVKPQILAKLFYFTWVLKMEQAVSFFNKDSKLRYYSKKRRKIEKFAKKNEAFINYYKSTNTHFDDQFFKRGNVELVLPEEPMITQYDTNFCTSHDYKAAKVIANEELAIYIDAKIRELNNGTAAKPNDTARTLIWTGDKIALGELIYALDAAGVINNGEAELVEITAAFQKIFNIDLGNFYHKFHEIKERKFNHTKFMHHLAHTLMLRIEKDTRR